MTLTSREVAAAAGMTLAQVRRLWRALGFADARGEATFTPADVEALSVVNELVHERVVDEETALQLTRALGRTMSRLAEWQVSTLAEAGAPRRASERSQAAFEQLLVYAWRRHLEAATARHGGEGAEAGLDRQTATQTVGFADLVGFTSLSNGLGTDELASLVEAFESRCSDLVAAGGGRVVKTLGDSVLFLAATPAGGTEIALAVVETIGTDPGLPDVRLGLATGPVVLRMGDAFGPPVNLAARLTAVARRNHVIIDATTARLLSTESYVTRVLPPRPMHGFGDVEPITVRRHWNAPPG